MITVKNLVLGMLSANCYFVQNPDTKEMFLVDPAASPERIEAQIAVMDGKPKAILLTHGHYDHMLAADEIRKKYGIPVYVHEKEQALLGNGEQNLSAIWSVCYTMQADRTVKEGDMLSIAGYQIQVIATPGHTSGSVCYYLKEEQILFSGDTLFCESYGRYDFPTSSGRALIASVKRLLQLPDGVKVYPGHNESTDIEHEKRYNPLA
ncbi:MAG: MBL fold metallo-hydrolase [Fusicatenibacter sp.]|nr:MBL fold metallo-hydrolase [Fusicatenibacter sp.]